MKWYAMRMNRQEIQVLQNESVKLIERKKHFKVVLAGGLSFLRAGIQKGNLRAVRGQS